MAEERHYSQAVRDKYNELVASCRDLVSDEDVARVRSAGNLFYDNHSEKEAIRILEIGLIVTKEIGLGRTAIICTFLHPLFERDLVTTESVLRDFGERECLILKGLKGVGDIYARYGAIDSEAFRKLLMTFAQDIRVQLIFLAESIYDLRHSETLGAETLHNLLEQTHCLNIPFAHRLGLYNIKSEMEDLYLRHTSPDVYSDIVAQLEESRDDRERYIARFIEPIEQELTRRGIRYRVKERVKTVASILHKMQTKQVEFKEIYDIFAVRFIVDSPPADEKADCWRVYSVVADLYTPNPQRLRDWISVPKSNGYESLQTTVLGPEKRWVEVQIRSERMDDFAEKGYASHWRYKGGESDKAVEDWLTELREILERSDLGTGLDDLRLETNEEVHVFTPAGDLKTLPAGASLLDFAYSIHTDVGQHCVGGKVNQRNETLRYVLQNGDQISILTSPSQVPKTDWLNYVITSKARSKIRQLLAQNTRDRAQLGKEMLLRRLKNWHIEAGDDLIQRTYLHFRFKSALDFYQAIVDERLSLTEVKEYLTEDHTKPVVAEIPLIEKQEPVASSSTSRSDVLLVQRDASSLDYRFARCCNPVFGDSITGFVSIGGGIKIHRSGCKNVLDLKKRYPYRIVPVQWNNEVTTSYQTVLHIVGRDGAGVANKITETILQDKRLVLRGLSIDSRDGGFDGTLTLLVRDTRHIDFLCSRLKRIKEVERVVRQDSVVDIL